MGTLDNDLPYLVRPVPTPVSLIIPIYNREAYLPPLIASILAQTYPDFELILWDDGSTDKSLAIAPRVSSGLRKLAGEN